MPFYIRPVTHADGEALSRICLLTANFGTSSEHLHNFKELPGLIYALPYVNLPTTFGFVLVDGPNDSKVEEVLGYILGTTDTPAFNAAAEADWYPPLRAKYPLDENGDLDIARTELDIHYIATIHRPHKPPSEALSFSPAHIHIDLLPQAQRQGWGRKLMGKAVGYLSVCEPKIEGLWVGVDPRNEEGKKFYIKIGGTLLPTSDGEYYALKFSDW